MEFNSPDTIVALSTAPGKAAIAIVRVSGPQAMRILKKHFAAKNGKGWKQGQALLGNLIGAEGRILDQAILLPFFAPHSYSGEDLCELHLHGSPYIVEQTISLLLKHCRAAEAGEFTRRAVMNGKLDLAQAEGVEALISSRSAMAHRLAHKALGGETSRKVEALRSRLIHLLALIEAELDFSEEEIDHSDDQRLLEESSAIHDTLQRWIRSYRIGRLVDGADVVLCGPPNAGKSTLMNALLQEDRVIVSEHPGTTRDSVSQRLRLGKIEVRLWDTAGLRDSDNEIENLGMKHTRELLDRADLVISLRSWDDPESAMEADEHHLRVLTKVDTHEGPLQLHSGQLAISALKGQGLDELKQRIELDLVSHDDGEDLIVSQFRHRQLMGLAASALGRANQAIEAGIDRSLLATDLRQAAENLGAIYGGFDVEEVLDSVFSEFCIGK